MSYVEIRGLKKAFGAVQALSDATLTIDRGTIHGLCGADGAGKSTLIRILAGATSPDGGTVVIGGHTIREFTPQYLRSLGVGVVFQELALVPGLRVYQNIFLGIEDRRGVVVPRANAMKARAREILARMGVDLHIESPTESLGLHQQQIVEIAKALCRGTSLLILDEPTAILNAQEKSRLFTILRELRSHGLAIIFITHFVGELFEVCDRLTVMRDGRTVQTSAIGDTDYESVVLAMVGAVAERIYPQVVQQDTREAVLSMHGGTVAGKFLEVNMAVHRGEIVGLAGLVGSGCYEVAEAMFGLRSLDHGDIRLGSRIVRIRSPLEAVRAGIAYVPEDRRKKGLCLNLSGAINSALPLMSDRRFSRLGFISTSSLHREFMSLGQLLRLHPLDPRLPASGFSGGNQQKLVIGKWIEKGFKVYILVEPTRGVDVGAKVEILKFIEQLGRKGAAIVIVSTDFDDIAAVCSRCVVFTSGRISGVLVRPQITTDRISFLAVNTKPARAA